MNCLLGENYIMENSRSLLEKKEQMRYEVLKLIYEKTGGSTSARLDLSNFFRATNLSPQETGEILDIQDAITFLSEEGLIEYVTLGYSYSITHRGVKEFEQSIREPARDTEHFSASVIQIFNAPVGTVQAGDNNNSYVNHNNDSGAEVQELIQQLKNLVSSLSEIHRKDASEVIEDLQEEIENPTKQSRLKSSLITLWQLSKDVAGFANSVSAIAQRFGIDLSHF
jgi:hypothetical protein